MKLHVETTNMKKIIMIPLVILSVLLLLVLINFVPVFSLKTNGMSVFEGAWVNVYCENEESSAFPRSRMSVFISMISRAPCR